MPSDITQTLKQNEAGFYCGRSKVSNEIQKSNQNTEYAEKANRNKAANTERNITDALIKDKEKMN